MTPPDRRSQPGRRPGRRTRPRQERGESMVGTRFDVEVGPFAHGGFCVARHEGRAVFVRHALPGERVTVTVTEGGSEDRFWRADAVAVLDPSPHRVEAPCPYAGPDACGGCDLQHVDLAHQRSLKAGVVAEQLRRISGLDVEVEVSAVPGDVGGLGWRTRQRYAHLPDGTRAMRKHRSHELVPVAGCLLEAPAEVAASAHTVHDVTFQVPPGGFWQVHPGAPETLVDAVMAALAPRAGEVALDLYAGVGLFSRFLVDAGARVTAVEGDAAAAALVPVNAPGAEGLAGDVAAVLANGGCPEADLVVLDPPREGAKRRVVEQVAARRPRAVAHVACDPASLARDVALFAEHGYRLASVRGFDLFPMTHHVECVALLVPVEAPAEP